MSKHRSSRRRLANSSELSVWFHHACEQEPGALQQLLTLYRPYLMKVAHSRLRGPLQTKVGLSDLVQETVLKATQNFCQQKFENRRGFIAWLREILKNEAIDVHRRYQLAKRRDVSRERSLFSEEAQNWLRRLSAHLSVDGSIASERRENVDRILAAMEKLPAHYKLAIRLRYYKGLDFGAIGARLDRSYDAARVLHNRALSRLRALLEGDLDEST